jgi:quinol-cytochrome oxidoreductase complex cytochrome b subunit/mono/diheme cytochrome c family protein
MIGRLRDWINHRIGLADIVQHALYEPIPGGARFRYITGSVLVFAFITQAVTGLFLWMAYSPSSQTAYESVWYIQHEMTGGWLVRGIHHFMAQAMVVVMALHMLQVIWDGAYRAPREVNYWLGLVLLQLVMGLGLTGYLLPWDQKGYWATNVATNLATLVPFVGKDLQQLAVGGNEYGHHTLTRFFAMHAGVLPALLVIFLVLHVAIFRRHGIMAKITPGRPDEYFWPRQVLFDALGCLVLLGVVLLCVIHFDVNGLIKGDLPVAHRGAELGAPADPAEAYSAARPEWYYLFLFQLLKYFPGSSEIIGAIVIPGIVMTLFALMPFIGRSEMGHRFNQVFFVLILGGAVALTVVAMREDAANQEFQAAKIAAHHDAERTHELIMRRETLPDGKLSDVRLIPKEGAVSLLRNDPLTRGPRLFSQHCASCHSYVDPSDPEGKHGQRFVLTQSPQTKTALKFGKEVAIVETSGDSVVYPPVPEAAGAPNLFRFASRDWIRGLLDPQRIAAPVEVGKPTPSSNPAIAADKDNPENYKRPLLSDYFGNTNHKESRMASWVKQHAKLLADDPKKHDDDVDAIAAALSAQAGLRQQAEIDRRDQQLIAKGIGLIQEHCTSCHRFGDHGQLGIAPDLTGYGSYEWMLGLVSDPTHERFYRMENDRMPSFAKDLAHPENNNVSIRELSLIIDWLRGDYYSPEDKQPVLSHAPEVAEQTVLIARTVDEPRSAIVGAATPDEETQLALAERLFAQNCQICHTRGNLAAKRPTAPSLTGFGSRQWVAGVLDPEKVAGSDYFGNTRHKAGDMAGFVKEDLAAPEGDAKTNLEAIIVALSAEAALPSQAEADKKAEEDKTLEKGRAAMTESFGNYACTDCHKFREDGDLGSAPDLTGWGSKDWLVKMISDPTHEQFYRDTNDRMPSFAKGGPKQALLSADQIDLLARWLRGEKLD